jgi:DNA-binding protein HU-beta
MRKSEFIDKVARKAEMSRESAARAVDAIFDTASGALAEAIRASGVVSLPGFGRFRTKKRAARRGRNPQTGEMIDIPERMVIQFTAGKGLQEILSEGDQKSDRPARSKPKPGPKKRPG